MARTTIPLAGGNTKVSPHNAYDFRPTRPATGNIFFVNSLGTAGTGLSPEDPKITLAAAEAALTTTNDDVVYVMNLHAESIVAAAGTTIAKSGSTWIGLGNGRSRPVITFSTSTAAQLIITGSNVTFKNLVFDFTGITAIVAAISVTGADVAFEDCEFIISTGTNAPVLGILTAATATRIRFDRCRFLGAATSTATCTAAIQHESGVDYIIRDCYFAGKFTQAILNVATVLRGLIQRNVFVIGTGTVAITMAAASTPMCVDNRFNMPSGTTPIVAAAGFVIGNAYSAAAGVTSGSALTW